MSGEAAPFNEPGFAYAETKNHQLRALSIDGVMQMVKIGLFNKGETYTEFGSHAGCENCSESDALANIQMRFTKK